MHFLKILIINARNIIVFPLVGLGAFLGVLWFHGWLVSNYGFTPINAVLIAIGALAVVLTFAVSLMEWWSDRENARYQDMRTTMIETAIRDQEKAATGEREKAAYQLLLTSFCNEWPSANDDYGIDFRNWKDRLDDLVERGLDLTKPNRDFEILLAAVMRYVAYNQQRADWANDENIAPDMRASFAVCIPHCLHASQACLQHLQDIQKSWSEGDTKSRGELSEAAEGETP